MPRASTGPEIAFRKALHAAGFRFTLHRRDLPGRPDVVLSRPKIAIFIDGCFWHACEEHGTLPKNNREWWKRKFEGNRERDRRKDEALRAQGWIALHFWEHEDVRHMVQRVRLIWIERTAGLR
jgi:DNA mismatch endonuclease (patch repair protein)